MKLFLDDQYENYLNMYDRLDNIIDRKNEVITINSASINFSHTINNGVVCFLCNTLNSTKTSNSILSTFDYDNDTYTLNKQIINNKMCEFYYIFNDKTINDTIDVSVLYK